MVKKLEVKDFITPSEELSGEVLDAYIKGYPMFNRTVNRLKQELSRYEWISINDRMPPNDKYVLVCGFPPGFGEPRSITIAQRDKNKWKFLHEFEDRSSLSAFFDQVWSMKEDEIAYWMPMPEIPKVKKDGV